MLKYYYYLPDKRKKDITKFESTHSQSNVTGIAALQNDSLTREEAVSDTDVAKLGNLTFGHRNKFCLRTRYLNRSILHPYVLHLNYTTVDINPYQRKIK